MVEFFHYPLSVFMKYVFTTKYDTPYVLYYDSECKIKYSVDVQTHVRCPSDNPQTPTGQPPNFNFLRSLLLVQTNWLFLFLPSFSWQPREVEFGQQVWGGVWKKKHSRVIYFWKINKASGPLIQYNKLHETDLWKSITVIHHRSSTRLHLLLN